MNYATVTRSEAETTQAGRALGAQLRAGMLVSLAGPLGAGKTAFARGVAEGLGCDPDSVSSPTFTIVQEYSGPVTMQHVDLYRLTPAEADDLGLADLMADSVMVIEWPERWPGAPPADLTVTIQISGPTDRHITVSKP